jgi:hypothetical protein
MVGQRANLETFVGDHVMCAFILLHASGTNNIGVVYDDRAWVFAH